MLERLLKINKFYFDLICSLHRRTKQNFTHLRVKMAIDGSYRSMHIILIGLSYIVAFFAGLHMSQNTPYTPILRQYNDRCPTSAANVKNDSKELSFFDIGTKHNTDKVTIHRYHTLYEKYVRKYIGTDVILLEIGLGCDISYGPGASALLWREYLGPRARVHFLEYDEKCARAWQEQHGKKVLNEVKKRKFHVEIFDFFS